MTTIPMIWRRIRLTPKKLLVLALFTLVSLVVVYCWQTKSHKEALEIGKVIATFEGLKYQKDFVGAIGMLTPPQNQEEKEWLDHLLGNDLADTNDGNPSPRFLNKVNFHLLVGYDIEKVTKKDNVFYAHVKEHRVLNLAEDGASSEYKAQTQDLTFELLNNGGSYEISRYYHTNPTSLVDLKYEGFVAG